MEFFDLYDEHRRPLGRIHRRGEPLRPEEFHVIVEVATVNSRGELLLTLRDARKHLFPGLWEVTGGAVQAGESSRQGAMRELREETGIRAEPDELTLLGSYRVGSVFADVYLLRRDAEIGSLALQQGETVDARWVSPEVFRGMFRRGEMSFPTGMRYRLIERALWGEDGPSAGGMDF